MTEDTVKKAYEQWFRDTQPKDAAAIQIIETRRAFFAGFGACLTTNWKSDTDVNLAMVECAAFFQSEVESGMGRPEGPNA